MSGCESFYKFAAKTLVIIIIMLNATLEKLGWEAHPYRKPASTSSYTRYGIAKTKTRRQDLPPMIVLHMTQGGTGWGKAGLIAFATSETGSPVMCWFVSSTTTSCTYNKVDKWDAERVIGSEGTRTGYSAKIFTLPITAPSWGMKGAGRNKLGRKRRSKITKLLLETNHSGRLVVQVEIVGFARDCKNFTDKEYTELAEMLADLAAAIEAETGEPFELKPCIAPRVDDPASRSKKAACRVPWDKWEMRDWNVCMHSNAPENNHGDAGLLDVVRLCREANEIVAERKGTPAPKKTKKAAAKRKNTVSKIDRPAILEATEQIKSALSTIEETIK